MVEQAINRDLPRWTPSLEEVASPVYGIDVASWQLWQGLVLDEKVALRYVSNSETLNLGFCEVQNRHLIVPEEVGKLNISRFYRFCDGDRFEVGLKAFYSRRGLLVCLGGIDQSQIKTPDEAGISFPRYWETPRKPL